MNRRKASQHGECYPFEIRDLASQVDRLAFKRTHTWAALGEMNLPPEHLDEMLYRRAADAIAREFAGKVLRHRHILRYDEPQGRVLRFDSVALRYDELLELLYRAYVAGQSNARRYAPAVIGD
jgi:hypothetical protein